MNPLAFLSKYVSVLDSVCVVGVFEDSLRIFIYFYIHWYNCCKVKLEKYILRCWLLRFALQSTNTNRARPCTDSHLGNLGLHRRKG